MELQPSAAQWRLVVYINGGTGATITDAGALSVNGPSNLSGAVAVGGGYTASGAGATITDAGILWHAQ